MIRLHGLGSAASLLLVLLVTCPLYADDTIMMRAGTAKAAITPQDGEDLTLVMGVKPSGVTHDIYARALVLNDSEQRLAIVTYDLNCLDVATPILRKRCRDELDIDASRLIILSTHNHAAPIQIVPDNFEYGRWLADRSFDLIEEAIAAERGPARVSIGSGNGHFVQSVGHAPVDSEIQVMQVDVNDKPLAVLFNHPTHPLQFSRTEIDTGHPGYAVDEIEAAMPGVMAMYADACGGNQFPDRGTIMYGTKEQMTELGHELATAVLGIIDRPLLDVTGPISSKLEIIPLPLDEPLSYEEAKQLANDEQVPLDIGLVPYPHPDRGTKLDPTATQASRTEHPVPQADDRPCLHG